jgi:hypothetical protein
VTLRGKSCLCRSCGAQFRAITTFDLHRSGPMTDRRCLTPTEMALAGLFIDRLGYWRKVNTWVAAAAA